MGNALKKNALFTTLIKFYLYNINAVLTIDKQIPGMDVTLPKGSTIYVATSGTNTDPRFFKDPEVFDPARTESDSGFSEAHLSFGIGPRSCIGKLNKNFIKNTRETK